MSRELHNESSLLIRAGQGDQRAFRVLFDHYRNKVYSYAFKQLKSEVLAEEIVQEVFLYLWTDRERLAQIENFGGFIRVLARNYAVTALRKIAREIVAFEQKFAHWNEHDLDTEHHILYNEIQQALNNALETLPPQQKLVYRMCRLDGMRQATVAEQLGISVLTVKTHLRAATQTVRAYIKQHGNAGLAVFFIAVNQLIAR